MKILKLLQNQRSGFRQKAAPFYFFKLAALCRAAATVAIALAFAGCVFASPAVFSIRDFGATGDGTNKDTVAFQKALDACAVSGGGEVLVPAGKYLIGSVQIGDHTILRLETNSVIVGSSDINDYPMMDIRWEGRWQPGRRALIYSANVDRTGIIGPGRIEGNPAVAAPQNPRGVVVLEPISCNDVRWEDFTVTQGGNWATHPTYCTDVVIKNVTISGSRDGIDVDSCKNVRIEDCNIDTGDDSISLKSGRGLNGARIGKPTEDVLITGCTLIGRRFACVGIGSETSGGIRNVRIEKCKMTSRTFGVYVKTRIGRAGVIENISGDDLDILGGGFLKINLISAGNLNTADDPVEGLAGFPLGKDFRFSNVRVTNCPRLVDAKDISPQKPLDGFSLANITGNCTNVVSLANITHAEMRDINVTGYTGPFLTQTNVQGSGLEAPR
jgi:polygalacturonase